MQESFVGFWAAWMGLALLFAAPIAGLAAWVARCRVLRATPGKELIEDVEQPLSPACLAAIVADLAGWQRAALAFAAGTVSVLAMAPFFLSPVLLVTLPVLVWLIDGARPDPAARPLMPTGRLRPVLRAAASGWWFGFGYFLAGLYWIGEAFLVEAEVFAWLLPFAVTIMPAGLALFFAAAAGGARLAWCRGPTRVLVLAVALALAEWLRGHILTGFPWNTLGYALAYPLPLMQSAAVFGLYGLTLLCVAIFAAPLVLLADGTRLRTCPPWLVAMATAALPLSVMFAAGSLALQRAPATVDNSVRIRIVQPSIPQREKWQGEKQAANFALHMETSRQTPDGGRDDLAGITHLVWPEAAMPFLPLDRPEALAAIGELLGERRYLLAGALRLQRPVAGTTGPARAFNSLLVFGPGGGLATLYDKIHLVPFGEYLPFQATLERMGLEQLTRQRGGFSSGRVPRTLLDVPGLPPLGPLICYEAIFPTEVIQGTGRPRLLLNITNDGWFGDTTGPHQHLHQARVRAVEQGVPLLRAANNGISAVIDSQGRILARLDLNRRGTIDTGLPVISVLPLYARYGEGVFALLVLVFLAWAGGFRHASP